jgi:hypothetical protein
MNKNHKPQVWVNGKRVKVVPQCAGCGLITDAPPPPDWEYLELSPWGVVFVTQPN